MRWWLAAVIVAAGLWPGMARAQGTGAPFSGERVLVDLTVWSVPPDFTSTCVDVPAGRLTVQMEPLPPDVPAIPALPVAFGWHSYRGADPGSGINLQVQGGSGSSAATLAGGRYCYSLRTVADVPADASLIQRTALAQRVAIRLALTPLP